MPTSRIGGDQVVDYLLNVGVVLPASCNAGEGQWTVLGEFYEDVSNLPRLSCVVNICPEGRYLQDRCPPAVAYICESDRIRQTVDIVALLIRVLACVLKDLYEEFKRQFVKVILGVCQSYGK